MLAQTDVFAIAQETADKAADEAATPEAQYDTYQKVYTETLERGKRAEGIVEAGLVSDAGNGIYHVTSSTSGEIYEVDLINETCTCPDHTYRETLCKHIQAAAIFSALAAEAEALEELEAEAEETRAEQIVLEVEGYRRGRQFINKTVKRVRVNGGGYRKAKSSNFETAIDWLMREGYEFDRVVSPRAKMGTQTAKYFYRK